MKKKIVKNEARAAEWPLNSKPFEKTISGSSISYNRELI